MVRSGLAGSGSTACSPHPRGDGPLLQAPHLTGSTFSPPAWGWSDRSGAGWDPATVLPTRVGMVRPRVHLSALGGRSPHPRGDGPAIAYCRSVADWFSPPAWGWSGGEYRVTKDGDVLPTRVGMVRSNGRMTTCSICSPHPRGDGPRSTLITLGFNRFSPPAWGWSGPAGLNVETSEVLPTRVGMVRHSWRPISSFASSPHPRGDGPDFRGTAAQRETFSPPAWGWSGGLASIRDGDSVLPTRVGMVRTSRPVCS